MIRKILCTFLIWATATPLIAQPDTKARLKIGATAGVVTNFQTSMNLKGGNSYYQSSEYNGIDLGGYIKYQKRAFVAEYNIAYQPTAVTLKYKHPINNELKNSEISILHTFRQQISIGVIINRKSLHFYELGAGVFMQNDSRNINLKTAHYDVYWDNSQNNSYTQPMLLVNRRQEKPFRAGIMGFVQYNNRKCSSPWSIRFSAYYNLASSNSLQTYIVALDRDRNSVEKYYGKTSNGQIMLSFSKQLFQWRKEIVEKE